MRYRPALQIFTTFFILIIVAALLLYSFGFSPSFQRPTGISALFTATSAVCVTGLTVVNLSSEMTFGGQLIVLIFIQLGGLGLLSLSNWILLSLSGRIGANRTAITGEILGTLPQMSASSLLRRVAWFTGLAEMAGAVILFIRFEGEYPPGEAIWLAVFHSISAFCNAGFSLFSDSLMHYRSDLVLNLTIMALIVLGGIGFVAAADIVEKIEAMARRKRRKLCLHTNVVLTFSAVLISSATVAFLIFEWGNPVFHESLPNRFFESLFLAVTSRTAGFNTVETCHLTNMTLLTLMFLMFVGASPGSTGGGIKTTTLAIGWALLKARLLNRPRSEIFKRSIPYDLTAKALAVVVLYVVTVILALGVLEATEFGEMPHIATRGMFLDYLFEVLSAMSTVGLTTGVTTKLSHYGLWVIMLCMFIGRIGPLVLVSSVIGKRSRQQYSYPEGDMMVG